MRFNILNIIQVLVQTLLQKIGRLEAEIVSLEAELVVYKNKKNSSYSHIPPAQDQNRIKKIKFSGYHRTRKQVVRKVMKVLPLNEV